ncbi:MAG: hypothetical protein RL017_616 [Pseudomonadota bacterium]|jgi:2-dehydro-3-deoxygluconokinase
MDLVTLGEALVVFSTNEKGPLRFINNFNKSMGGAEANVAIALARLGFKTGWISRLGDDEFGNYILFNLKGEGVDVSEVTFDSNNSTAILFKEQYQSNNPNVYYYRKNSAFTTLTPQHINENYIARAKFLHLTGITPALTEEAKNACFTAINYAKAHNLTISFDPNLRFKLWPDLNLAKQTMIEFAKCCDIIFPGLDEAQLILGLNSLEEICAKFHSYGCKIVVIKLGDQGCAYSNGDTIVKISAYKVEHIIDTAGAGDGFAAGFIAGMLDDKPLDECAKLANAIGAMAVLVKGDNAGYPTWRNLDAFMGKSIQRSR